MVEQLISSCWFVVALVFFILWLTKKGSSSNAAPSMQDRYSQGFWDGYRDLGTKIQRYLHHEHPDKGAIQQLINVGFGGSPPPDSLVQHPTFDQVQESLMEQPAVIELSPEQLQAEKAKESLKNFNILLFMGSLLLVAAGAAFVAAAMPNSVKLFGVWILVLTFYSAGMALHYNSERLRAAAVAFIGTGLALVPFAGVALHQLGEVDPAVAWCVTSLIGLIGYFFAAIRLQSQVVSYLTLAFVISLASSFTESVGVPLVWNFVVIIGIGLVFNMVAIVKPNWVPKLFAKPIEQSGQIVTPVALVASLFLYNRMSLFSYEIVFGVATLHYVVTWLQTRRAEYEAIVRTLAHITALIIAWDVLHGERVAFGLAFLFLAVAQQAYSFMALEMSGTPARRTTEKVWVSIMQMLELLSIGFWVATINSGQLSSLSFFIIGLSSLVATFYFRSILLAIPGLVVSVILPFIVARQVFEPALDYGYLAGFFTFATALVMASYQLFVRRSTAVRYFMTSSFVVYLIVAAMTAALLPAWGHVLVLAFLVSLAWLGSYQFRQSTFSIIGNVLFVIAVGRAWDWLQLDMTWFILGVAWITSAVFYTGYWALLQQGDKDRSTGLLWSAWVVLGMGILFTFFASDVGAASALSLVALAGTIAIEGWRLRQMVLIESSVYVATFGLQRFVGVNDPDLNVVFYGHWWALTLAAVAAWRMKFKERLIIGMSFITFTSGIYALNEGGGYQLLFLVEHIGLLIAGALLSRGWAIWWGLIGAALAVLYFLKDIAFLAFAFLGLLVIGIVVWRLMRIKHTSPTD
jgi:hypothetical protein